MENGGVRAVLVVPTARVLVYNYLPAPYLPAGGLPDRHVRHPTGPSGPRRFPEILKFANILKFVGGDPPPPPVCVCVSEPPAEKISPIRPGGRAWPAALLALWAPARARPTQIS